MCVSLTLVTCYTLVFDPLASQVRPLVSLMQFERTFDKPLKPSFEPSEIKELVFVLILLNQILNYSNARCQTHLANFLWIAVFKLNV